MRRIDSLKKMGVLNEVQLAWLAETKPEEELYDLENDPYEIHNLAGDPKLANIKKVLASELKAWQTQYGDWLDTPEIIQAEKMWPGGKQPVTAQPTYAIDGRARVIYCGTQGASIGYRYKGEKFWRLYSKPIPSDGKGPLEVKAVRYGFTESTVLTIE